MRFLIGIGLKVLATLCFTIMAAMIKAVGEAVPLGQIIFSRNFFALIPILAMLAWQGNLATGLKTKRPGGHAMRAVIGGFSMFCVFKALQLLTLPDATAISFATPLFIVVFAALFLGEVIRIYRWSAVAVGFVGVFIMLAPHLSLDAGVADSAKRTGTLFALIGAFSSAFAVIQVRRLTQTETTPAIAFYFALIAAMMGLMTLPAGWVWPDAETLVWLIGIGIVGGVAQILVTQSYRYAPASVIAPFDYVAILWSVLVGFVFFSEMPTRAVLIGAVFVIAAGIFVIYREARIGIDRKAQKEVRLPFGD